jgi:hypothetical protein
MYFREQASLVESENLFGQLSSVRRSERISDKDDDPHENMQSSINANAAIFRY